MAPTPPSTNFQHHFRNFGRARRRGNTNPYDAAHTRTPQEPVTPLDFPGEEVDGDREREADGDTEPEEEEEESGGEEGEEDDEEVSGDDDDTDPAFDEDAFKVDEEGGIDEVPMDLDPPFDATALGLKEISNLASWTVSSSKPGCGVEALRDEDTGLFWQSDGPQPHHLNIHFSRMVSIRAIRIFLNYEDDESYTPTKISLLAGTGYHDLIPFAALEFTHPKGWIPVNLDNVGGGEDGKTLRAFLVQIKIVENHQNGKDTHVRGLKIYARDERAGRSGMDVLVDEGKTAREIASTKTADTAGFLQPDWMREPEIR